MAAERIDSVILEHSALLMVNQLLPAEEYLDMYREQYATIEMEALAVLSNVLARDTGGKISLRDDLDPILQLKLQQFAWHFYPKDPGQLN